MRHIIFKEVGMKNYGPYIDEMTIPLNQHNLTTIVGPNGIGKTMILDSIPFSLYGITSDGKRGDDVVNNIVGKNCHTWLTFSVDNIPYRIDRYHKHSKFGNTVKLVKDNSKLGKDNEELGKGQRELLPLIESIVVSQKLFMNTLFFGQNVKTFFTDLPDSEKKDIFRKILDLDKYTLYYDETSKRLKELLQQNQTLTNNIAIKVELVPNLEKQLLLLQEEEKEFNRRKEILVKMFQDDIKTCKNEIKNVEKMINDIDETLLTKINQELAETKASLNSCKNQEDNDIISLANSKKSKENELRTKSNELKETKRNEISKNIQRISENVDLIINGHLENIKKLEETKTKEHIKMSNLDFQIVSLVDQEKDLKTNILTLSTCPTCLQPLDEKGKQNLKAKVNEIIKQRSNLQIDRDKLQTMLNKGSQILEELKQEMLEQSNKKQKEISEQQTILSGELQAIDEKEQAIFKELNSRVETTIISIHQAWINLKKELEQKITNLLTEQQRCQKSFDEYKKLITNVEEKKAKIASLIKSIEEKQNEIFDTRRSDEIKREINSIRVEIHSLQGQQKQLLKQQEILEFWKIGFSSSGIPSLLIDESIPFMNQRVSYYLDKISNGRYTVSFDTLQATKAGEFRDKISVNVLDNITKANSRIQLSGGQTRIVDIATILTLCDLQSSVQNVTFNLLLFDEIFDSLDDENIGFVSKVLKDLSREKSLFIISHRYIDQIEADNVISLR